MICFIFHIEVRAATRKTCLVRSFSRANNGFHPFYRDLFRLLKIGSDLHERNVDEMLAQSRQQLGARVLHHGKQQVSPFYHVSQLLHEKNVFRSLKEIFGGGRGDASTFYMTSPVYIRTTFGIQKAGSVS